MFRLLKKYKPETKQERKARLVKRAQKKIESGEDKPTKRRIEAKSGARTVVKLIEQKRAKLVMIAADVDPIEVRCCWD